MANIIVSDSKISNFQLSQQLDIPIAIIDADNYYFAKKYDTNIYIYNYPTNSYSLYRGVSHGIAALEYIDGYLYVLSDSTKYTVIKNGETIIESTHGSLTGTSQTYHVDNTRIYVFRYLNDSPMYVSINQTTHALSSGGSTSSMLCNYPVLVNNYYHSGAYKISGATYIYGIYRTSGTYPYGNMTTVVNNANLGGGFSFVLDNIFIQSRTGYSYNFTNNTTSLLDIETTSMATYMGDFNPSLKIAVVPELTTDKYVKFIKWQSVEYDITYSIKDKTGNETYVTSEHNSPITKVRFNYSGSTVSYIFTTLSGNISGTYTPTLPEESTLAGFSRSPNSNIVEFGLNSDISIYFDENTTFYEVYKKYVPPATTFSMNLYTNTANRLVLDKESFLTLVGTLNGALRERCDIVNPKIIIEYATIPNFNYVQIPIWSRYYYVTDVVSVRKNLWEISLTLDERFSYKNDILALNDLMIARAESNVWYNPYLVDEMIPTESGTQRTVIEIPNPTLPAGDPKFPFVVTVIATSNTN